MTPAKRRPATPATQGPARVAPDVPIVAASTPVSPRGADGAELLGPEGEPIAQEASTGDGRGYSAPPTRTDADAEDEAKTQARRRPSGLYPLPVWPD